MTDQNIISSDSHVFEPADLWQVRIESRWRERAPKVIRFEDGDWVVCDGIKLLTPKTPAGLRFEGQEKLSFSGVYEDVRPGGYIPEEHVKDLDIDGIEADVIYPTTGLILYQVPDSELLTAVFRVYNDWIAEFCNAYPRRLKGIAMLNTDEVGSTVKELERCAGMGLAGAMVSVYPGDGKSYALPEYDPLWAAALDLRMPLSLHVATNRPGTRGPAGARPNAGTNRDHWVRESLSDIIFAGVFERYPELRVGSVEHELSWVPYFLSGMDYDYTQRPYKEEWVRFKNDMLPSDFYYCNIFVSFQEDGVGIRLRDVIGMDNIMWGNDYPHRESTFPRSQQILQEILADCTEEEKAKIVGGNAARVYQID